MTRQCNVRLPQKYYNRMAREAVENGLNVSDIVRERLLDYETLLTEKEELKSKEQVPDSVEVNELKLKLKESQEAVEDLESKMKKLVKFWSSTSAVFGEEEDRYANALYKIGDMVYHNSSYYKSSIPKKIVKIYDVKGNYNYEIDMGEGRTNIAFEQDLKLVE